MAKEIRRFVFGALALTLTGALILSGCSSNTTKPTDTAKDAQSTKQTPVVGGTMIYTTIGDAANLLPILTADTASSFVSSLVYDSLLTRDDKLNYLPGVAESYTIDQDKIYTFKLRKDVKFQDGKPLTSADVLFTFQAVAHPKYQGVRFSSFTGIKGWEDLGKAYEQIDNDLKEKKIDAAKADTLKMDAYNKFLKEGGLTAPDEYTVKVELAEPFAPFLNNFTGYGIMPKHVLEGKIADLKNSPDNKKPMGSGAYKFVEWVKDDHITLQRNPDWKWGVKQKPNYIEKMIVKVVPDSQANMVALETGETDFASIQPDNFAHFKADVKHVNTMEYMTFSYTYLGYNLKNPMFADPNVRKAITHAINRQEIVDKLLLGHGALANSHGNPVRWDFNPNVPVYNYDTAKAEQMLDAAGWKKGADGIREKDGQKMAFEIATNNGNKIREQSAVIIQQALKKVGIDAKVNLMEWNAFLDYIDSDKKQAYILGWSLGYDPDAYSIFHTQGGFNQMHGYSNKKIDELIEQGRKVTDQKKRTEIYGEMQKILAEDQPYTWLFFSNSITGINKRIAGLPDKGGPAGVMWQFEEWYLTDVRTTK